MKKKYCLYFLLISILLFSSGCFKSKTTLNANSNDSSNETSKSTNASEVYNKPETSNKVNKNSKENTKEESTKITSTGAIPVLMYHSIGFEEENPVRLPLENLKKQMKYLKDNDYTPLSLDELYNYFVNKEPLPKRPIVLTFDDGYLDNYTKLYPILKKYNFKATIFVITASIDKEKDFLTLKQLRELDNNCISIESHTVSHEKLAHIPYTKQLETLKKSKAFLEKNLNKKVNYIAYPYGEYNKDTIKATKEAGYTMAFTTHDAWASSSNGLLSLNRVYISGFYDLETFIKKIKQESPQ